MSVTIVNLDKVKFRLGRVEDVFKSQEALNSIGNYIIFRIKDRTTSGRDVRGMFFQPYAPAYKMWRKKWGYKYNRVDLTLTGAMLAAMTYKVSSARQEVKVFFMSGTSRKSRGQQRRSTVQHPAKAFYLQQKRKFFSLAKKDEVKVRQIYQNAIRNALSGS